MISKGDSYVAMCEFSVILQLLLSLLLLLLLLLLWLNRGAKHMHVLTIKGEIEEVELYVH